MTSIYDHLKVNIEQTAKGARVTVTYDRSDHDIGKAVQNAVSLYQLTMQELINRKIPLDEVK